MEENRQSGNRSESRSDVNKPLQEEVNLGFIEGMSNASQQGIELRGKLMDVLLNSS